jgi:Uma2 family endonuclease
MTFSKRPSDFEHEEALPTGRFPRLGAQPVATATHTQAFSSWPLPAPDAVYRLTIEQFDRMVRDGTLDEDEPVELLNGVLVTKMPNNPPHRVATRKTVRALERVLPAGWIVQKEESLVMPPANKWEPDVAVVRSELEFDSARDATAADCCIVVEIAETNLARARSEELPAYAAAGIPVYWIVDLSGGATPGSAMVEVCSEPDQATGRYRSRVDVPPGDDVSVVIDGREVGRIGVADLLP